MGEWPIQFLDNSLCRDLPGFHGYKIGRDGSAWSVRRGTRLDRLLGYRDHLGYRQLKLTDNDGAACIVLLHAAVLAAFVGPRPDGNVCRHLDGNPENNLLENLSYGTQKENIEDCIRHGTIAHGEKCGLSRLNEQQVRIIRVLRFSEGLYLRDIASIFGVCHKTIMNICNKKTWVRLSEARNG